MTDKTREFIDALANGNNADAGEAFKDALRAKVGDALELKRQEVASNLFTVQSHSDPKPEIASPGTFNQDGTISHSGDLANDGSVDIDLTTNN
jgi:hypothetical protein